METEEKDDKTHGKEREDAARRSQRKQEMTSTNREHTHFKNTKKAFVKTTGIHTHRLLQETKKIQTTPHIALECTVQIFHIP